MNFLELTRTRLAALCQAARFDIEAALDACNTLLGPTGLRPIDSAPAWPSDITDDHTPVELSVGLEEGRAEPRFLVESLGDAPTLAASWRAGLATCERLRERYGAPLDRLALVEELFRPRDASCRFAMWHAAWLREGRAPLFKVYLNPVAGGPERAPALIEEALKRLGFNAARSCLRDILARRSADHLIYFSLDLDASAAARVKVYVAHPAATASDVEPLLALSPGHVAGDGVRFCRALSHTEGPYKARPLLTCYAFTSGDDARPDNVTLHLPIRCYVPDDRVALERMCEFLGDGADGAGDTYRAIVQAVASRPLAARPGLQTYASFRRHQGALRATSYLALEAYSGQAARAPVRAKPIAYDWHDRNAVELYYGVDARTGKRTCMASCEHCFLRANERTNAFKQEVAEAAAAIAKLRAHGYVVAAGLSETFAEDGAYLRARIAGDGRFVVEKMAWSSGMPLVKGDSMELLQLAVDAGIELVSMTSHGITDHESPFRGIIPPSTVREAVRRIQAFNAARGQRLRISLTFTLGRWNFSRERLQAYFDYCEALGVDTLRFNNYCDHTLKHPELALDRAQAARVYATVKELYERHPGKLGLSVSEDFGMDGVEVMGWPARVGDCAAGENLFGVLYPAVHACPQLCNMPVGRVTPGGAIEWDEEKLALVREAKRHPDYTGCLGVSWSNSRALRELLRPVTDEDEAPARNAVARSA